MPFRSRNTFYLRLSAQDVVPLYVYLDDRHIDWMTDKTLQSVVSDLRSLVGQKLRDEKNAVYGSGGPANAKRGTVEVHRGDHYQFAYFLRKADPHTVVLKTRHYVMLPPGPKPPPPVASPTRPDGKRKRSATSDSLKSPPSKATKRSRQPKQTSKKGLAKSKGKGKAVDVVEDSEEEAEESPLSSLEEDEPAPTQRPVRRSSRMRKLVSGEYREDSTTEDEDVDMQEEDAQVENTATTTVKREASESPALMRDDPLEHSTPAPSAPSLVVDEDELEEKPKPVLRLEYKGLDMGDRCLCVVVEPWPALPAGSYSRAASVAPPVQQTRDPSIAPPDFVSSTADTDRGQTPLPLFLPDFSRDRSATPAPVRFPSVFSSLTPMEEVQDLIDEDEGFGMMQFSQVLSTVAGERTSGLDEDDEIDGSVLYGDADEIRGIIQ